MFTVKWVLKTTRGEITRMLQAEDVKIACAKVNPPGSGTTVIPLPWMVDGRVVEKALVILDGPSLHGRSFDCGTFYIMNEQGATVGKYVLSEDPIVWDQAYDGPDISDSDVAKAA